MNLVLLETSGNQAYIFATNKLRENVGASELTYRVGTQFVWNAVASVGGKIPIDRQNEQIYPALDDQNPVEVIMAVSGKALLLVRDGDIGRRIVRVVTLQALKKAPGLEVHGVVSRDFHFGHDPIHTLIEEVHQQFQQVRSRLAGPAVRFQRLPIIAECASSGLPAQRLPRASDGLPFEEHREYAASVFAKIRARKKWKTRLDSILARRQVSAELPDASVELEELGSDWLAIIHADGNGLGQVFRNFDKRANTTDNRDYIAKLRSFSSALDECTEKAFCYSLRMLSSYTSQQGKNIKPIVPLILGGDDLTVICDGRQALQFTKSFIDNFEEQTRRDPRIQKILTNGATSCAGVAIVKPHFPFFAGYQLAEELLKSAKTLKPHSAIDYHIMYDTGGIDLGRIRQALTIGSARLLARPYAVREANAPLHRAWSDLERRVKAILATDPQAEDRRCLPNSLLHELREGLFLGREAAESRLALVRHRYRPHIDPLLVNDKLFWTTTDQANNKEIYLTGLLDALDAAEFWRGSVEV
jgi:hypothetical protein